MANHRDGGRDPTELELTVQPANTARPVGRHTRGKYPSQPVMGGQWFQHGRDTPIDVGSEVARPFIHLTVGEASCG